MQKPISFYTMRQRIIFGIVVAVALLGGLFFYLLKTGKTVNIVGQKRVVSHGQEAPEEAPKRLAENPLTGETCDEGDRRPMAVMLAADHVARPLLGLVEADIVVEMPALTNGITRYMAVFACSRPDEIGSIRSARHDFLPFVKSFDAIFAHWGGSSFALDILKNASVDNIDSIKNPFDAFWRRNEKAAPHNGFTSFTRLLTAAQKLGYRTDATTAKGYPHIGDEAALEVDQNISLGYPRPYNVDFAYDHTLNAYRRWRGGEREVDERSGAQVEVKNVIVMVSPTKQINADYNEVDVEGQGEAVIYRNGEVIKGSWKRATETYGAGQEDDTYYFLDTKGKEIGFVPGKIWISVVQPNQKVELTLK